VPNDYATLNTKKFLDVNGLNHFSSKLNEVYPDWDAMETAVNTIEEMLDSKVDVSDKGVANGVASLDQDGLVPVAQLPLTNTTYSFTQDQSDPHIIRISGSDNTLQTITTPDSDTTYNVASPMSSGLMSPQDKLKLDGISSNANEVDISFDSSRAAIVKTVDGTQTNIVTATALKQYMQLAQADVGLDQVDNTSDADKPISTATQAVLNNKIDYALKGMPYGVAELDENGKVPSSQLPSYVDDVLEYESLAAMPVTGESDKIYIDASTNKTYRWSGSTYVEITSSITLGTTSSSAFRGDYGAAAYAHAVTNKGSAFSSGLYKITTNSEGHVTAAQAVTAADIEALGVSSAVQTTRVRECLFFRALTAAEIAYYEDYFDNLTENAMEMEDGEVLTTEDGETIEMEEGT